MFGLTEILHHVVNANNIESGELGVQPVQWKNGIGRGVAGFCLSTVSCGSLPFMFSAESPMELSSIDFRGMLS